MKAKYDLKAVDQKAKKIMYSTHSVFTKTLSKDGTKEETNFILHLLHIYYSTKTLTLSGKIQCCRNRQRLGQRSCPVLPCWLESTGILKFKILIGQHVEECS